MEEPQKPLTDQSTKPEEGVVLKPILPVELVGGEPPDWYAIKQEYLTHPDIQFTKLAKKYSVSSSAIRMRAKKENWKQQQLIFQANVDLKTKNLLEDKIAKINADHATIGRFMQKTGIDPLKTGKVTIRSAKTALEFIVAGTQLERQASGLDKQTPQVVNIIAQQQSVIDKYKK